MQLTLLSNWIDGLAIPPKDGAQVLAYTLVSPGEDVSPVPTIQHNGREIFGPCVRTYEKEFVDLGWHKKIAYWQPIEPLL